MLSNPAYIRFSRDRCVELMCMKDIERALAERPERARTYRTKDAYGDEIECFERFPGVTVDEMKALHEGKPLEYMKGSLMPYTAVVDPHTLEDMGGIGRGAKATADAFIDLISRHGKALEARHGRGVDISLWDFLVESQVRADLLLGEGKLPEALSLLQEMERRSAREGEAVRRKVEATREVVLGDAAARLDEIEREMKGGRGGKVRPEAQRLAKLLHGTPLEDRAEALASGDARTKPITEDTSR